MKIQTENLGLFVILRLLLSFLSHCISRPPPPTQKGAAAPSGVIKQIYQSAAA